MEVEKLSASVPFSENTVTEITLGNGQLTIYDLTGRKVTDTENLKGGIYIVNGRKVIK